MAAASPAGWSDLLRLRVPAALSADWARLAPVPLVILDGSGVEIARFGAAESTTRCAGDCGAGHVGAPEIAACRRAAGLFHLAAPIKLSGAHAGAVAVTGAFRRAEDGPNGDAAPLLLGAVADLLLSLLAILAREMSLYWGSRRAVRRCPSLLGSIIGASPQMRAVLDAVERFARTERTVLVTGETGTGKELITRALHDLSRRASGPFVVVQCAAIPEGLLEAELFGHTRGAFTGAVQERRGLFEAAHNGTLFLDEVASMSLAFQGKLLRALEFGTFQRVGGGAPIRVNVRAIAASNCDLRVLVREGRFREDLFHRLNVLSIVVPPLRERPIDIEYLAAHFIAQTCAEEGIPEKRLTPEALRALHAYSWPGNVRELEHAIERAVIESPPGLVRLVDLAPEVRAAAGDKAGAARKGGEDCAPSSFREIKLREMEAWERQFLARELETCGGNQSLLARKLRMSRRKLGQKIQAYGLSRPQA
jgi:DNA-binding NtrC family response regulator